MFAFITVTNVKYCLKYCFRFVTPSSIMDDDMNEKMAKFSSFAEKVKEMEEELNALLIQCTPRGLRRRFQPSSPRRKKYFYRRSTRERNTTRYFRA